MSIPSGSARIMFAKSPPCAWRLCLIPRFRGKAPVTWPAISSSRASALPSSRRPQPRELGQVRRRLRMPRPAQHPTLLRAKLAEVQVFSGGENIALRGEAKQSSTYQGAIAAHAIDGRTDAEYDKGSIAHTDQQANPWWEVDLKTPSDIDRIVVWNRAELGERMDGSL